MASVAAAGFCPFISAASPTLFGFQQFHRPVQAARSREDLRDDRIRQLARLPRQRGFPFRHPGAAARPRPPALWPRDHARSTSSISRKVRPAPTAQCSALPHDQYCWMNAAFVHGRAAHRRFRQERLVHCHPRCRERRQGRAAADARVQQRRRRCRPEMPDRGRHHRPARQRTRPSSASCRCATTRTPTTPCSSARRPRTSRRNTTAPKRPTTRRSPPACPISWRRRASRII